MYLPKRRTGNVDVNENLLLFHNTRHASPRHRELERKTDSTSPWLVRFDLIIDAPLDWKPGNPTIGRLLDRIPGQMFMPRIVTRRVHPPKTVFVKTNHLRFFIKSVLPEINHEFVLYVGNADKSIGRVLNLTEMCGLLADDRIVRIFTEQKDVDSRRIVAMPIGIHPAALICYGDQLRDLVKAVHTGNKKKTVAGAWSRWPRTVFGARRDRTLAEEYMKANREFCHFFHGVSHVDYWKILSEHRFFLSPLGLTYDSFKTFEALAVKTIPIIQRLGVWQEAYKDLPVVVIDDFWEITPANLDKWWEELSPLLPSVRERLRIDYWWDKVNQYAVKL